MIISVATVDPPTEEKRADVGLRGVFESQIP